MSELPADGVIPEWTRQDRLQKALDYAGVHVGEMAEYLGVSRNTVGNYLAGRTDVTLGTMRLWAMKCGVSLLWLELGVGSSHPSGDGESVTPRKRRQKLPRLDSNQEPAGWPVSERGYRPAAFAQVA